MGKSRIRGSLGCVLFLVLATFTSCGSLISKKDEVPKLLTQRKVDFMTKEVLRRDIEDKIEVKGRIYSRNIQKLAFKKIGKLSFYDAYVGKHVKKGQVLASVDISEIEHKIKISKLKIEQCEIRQMIAENTGDKYKIKEAEIALKIEKMELDKLNEYKNNSTLISEIQGIVSSYSKKDIGTMVNPNITLITLMDSTQIGIRFKLNDNNLSKIQIGDTVEVSLGENYVETKVSDIEGNYVIAEVPESLKGEYSVTSNVKVRKVKETIKDALLIPKVGVYLDANGNNKVQLLKDGKIEVKQVVLGIELDEDFQVLEGVEEGDQIIVK